MESATLATDEGEERLFSMIASACFARDADTRMKADLRLFLIDHGIEGADLEALLSAPPRLLVYRRLIRTNLEGVVGRMMPRVRARVNDVAFGAFDQSFSEFLEQRAPRTHYLKDVAAEFLAWVTPRWKSDSRIPPYASDLASHELSEFLVGAISDRSPAQVSEQLALDAPLAFSDARALARYEFAVHLLSENLDDRSEPERRSMTLLVYRDPEHSVRYLELSPLAATILEHLFEGEPLSRAMPSACVAHSYGLDDAILQDTARLLADLADRGVFLGVEI